MSFIVKGFDIDGNCLHCFFQSEDTDRCLLTDDEIPLYGKGHPESCPLIPLPEGHGRLGDLDAIIGSIGDVPYKGSVRRVLMSAPTIVPEEGGGEDG